MNTLLPAMPIKNSVRCMWVGCLCAPGTLYRVRHTLVSTLRMLTSAHLPSGGGREEGERSGGQGEGDRGAAVGEYQPGSQWSCTVP